MADQEKEIEKEMDEQRQQANPEETAGTEESTASEDSVLKDHGDGAEREEEMPEDSGEESGGEDAEAEPPEGEDPKTWAEKRAAKKQAKLDKKSQGYREQIGQLEDKVKRQLAEFENFRNRTEKEKHAMFETGAKSVVEKILPVVDNF